ncbi:DUF58 domain-containing protein [Spiractinospora alimapuensis]|uniref:DUF58 domain-containing protein n=1 Tax=Spiractinospora alimapuensis TaxID=2820884 RepID=UPI001F380E9D|nr:DUF58 domain-containing protein [Spiractinospora alimapuensis]QVQ53142.1 DUF58 domain-containing protein [Spiractinospora alimapuensis]
MGSVRRVLAAFTPRGRALIVCGVLAVTASLVTGERDLMRVGVFVALIPLLGVLSIVGAPMRLRHTRALEPPRIATGQETRVHLRLSNPATRGRTSTAFVTDTVPHSLGGPPRFQLGPLRHGERRELTYRVRAQARGRFPIGPLRLSVRDALGCVELRRTYSAEQSLVVTPAVVELPAAAAQRARAGGGPSRARMVASSGEDDSVPREYRHGDELRRIHWRSTARHSVPMVRREEQQWQEHCTLLLDTRVSAHAGRGRDSSLETAVAVAASIGRRVLSDGLRLHFVSTDQEIPTDARAEGLLEALALLRGSRSASVGGRADLLGHARTAQGGLTVAVLGALRPGEAETLAETRRGEDRAVAILNPLSAWTRPTDLDTTRAELSRTGWRTITLSSLAELPPLWPEALRLSVGARLGPTTGDAGSRHGGGVE